MHFRKRGFVLAYVPFYYYDEKSAFRNDLRRRFFLFALAAKRETSFSEVSQSQVASEATIKR